MRNRLIGAYPRDEDVAAHQHMWRYVGWLLGIDERLLPESMDAEIELWRSLVAHQAMPMVLGEGYLDAAVAGIAEITGMTGWKRRAVREVMIHLSGPAWFGLDEPARTRPMIVGLQGVGALMAGAYYHVPGASGRLVARGRKRMADSLAVARTHGYGVEVESAETAEHERVMQRIAAQVQDHFLASAGHG